MFPDSFSFLSIIIKMFSVTRVFSTTTNNKSALEKASAVKLPLLQRVLSVRKVARVNSGGKVRSTSALVVVGDMNGNAGYGMGRGNDTISAVLKATEQAKKNMKSYLR
jgi:ribosomal protein S5